MDNSDCEEGHNKKRPHLNSTTTLMARSNSFTLSPHSHNTSVDAAVLQYQNQKLVQQLDQQKQELQHLDSQLQLLKQSQSTFDLKLITLHSFWNQLVDDLVLLTLRAGAPLPLLQHLHPQASIPSCPAEDLFLCRLLNVDSIDPTPSYEDDYLGFVEQALVRRHSTTSTLLTHLEDIIKDQFTNIHNTLELCRNLSTQDAIIQLNKLDSSMIEEANNLQEVVRCLQDKHKEYADRITICIQNQSVDQSETKRVTGELEESMSELEEIRRKLVNLRMQKRAAAEAYSTVSGALNGNLAPEELPDRTMGLQELKDSIEEAKIVAAERLSELEDAREDNLALSKQLENLENETKDEQHVVSSRLYTLLNDQLHHWKAEVVRYKTMADSLQAERSYLVRREKELEIKAELTENAKASVENDETRVEDLERQLHTYVHEKNDIEVKMEEAVQDSGRKDIKTEFNVMLSALSKEMAIVEAHLNRWKDIAHEALSLREEAHSHKAMLCLKTSEVKALEDKCAQQMVEIKTLKEMIENWQKVKLELQVSIDMYGQGIYDNRDLMEIEESERRACSQVEVLKQALAEHNLELRMKAANEAEAACQQRLSAAEVEIVDLRVKLDATERDVHELREAIRMKDAEAEAYISEIETIGQAYEDMQTQNQHLLQQMSERDDYNIKLVSESVKMKQSASVIHSDNQAMTKQFQLLTASLESLKARISQNEHQMKAVMLEAINCSQEDKQLVVSLEMTKWELADAEKESKWLKYAFTSSEKEYEQIQRKHFEAQQELDSERDDAKKLKEELNEWSDKVAEMTSETGDAAIQRLEDEIKDCKAILKCGVCFDRPKEVVIVKCYHLFCNQCIQRNLEIRHRKCPGCGTAFGQNDVRFVKI